MKTDQSQIIENGHIVRSLLREFAENPDRFDDDDVEAIWMHLDECEECTKDYDRIKDMEGESSPGVDREETVEATAPATEAVTLDADDFKQATLPGLDETDGPSQSEDVNHNEENVAESRPTFEVTQNPHHYEDPYHDEEEFYPSVSEPESHQMEQEPAVPSPEPVPEPVSEPASELVSEPASESIPEPVSEPASELVSEPVSESVPEPASESIPEPVSEPVSEPVPKEREPEKFLRASDELRGHLESRMAAAIVLERPTELCEEIRETAGPDSRHEKTAHVAPGEPQGDSTEKPAPPLVPRPPRPASGERTPGPSASKPASSVTAPQAPTSRPRRRKPGPSSAERVGRVCKNPIYVAAFIVIIVAVATAVYLVRRPPAHPNPVAGWATADVIKTRTPLQEIPLRKLRKGWIPPADGTDADLNFRGIKELVVAGDLDFLSKKSGRHDLVVRDAQNVAVFGEAIPEMYIKDGRFFLRLVPRQFTENQIYTLSVIANEGGEKTTTVGECVFRVLK